MEEIEKIDAFFEGWGGPNPQPRPSIRGFVGWAWDVREDVLQALMGHDDVQLALDIQYSLQQASSACACEDAQAWIDQNRHFLVVALSESLGLDEDDSEDEDED